MSPQGFGFESRKGDRRQVRERRTRERRGVRDRRLGDRRRRPKLVDVERRLSGNRRALGRRALVLRNNSRRKKSDRRSNESRGSSGLRITQDGFRHRPSVFGPPGHPPPPVN